MTKVVHVKKDPYDLYIGRPTPWGNPYVIGIDGTREEVVTKYEQWILGRPQLLIRIPTLQDKVLGCWCAPKGGVTLDDPFICHGQVLLKLLASN